MTTSVSIPVNQQQIVTNLEQYTRYAQGALAQNTKRAIQTDINRFVEFCASSNYSCLPASPETVSAFVEAMSDQCSVATIRRQLSSISTYHQAAGLDSPTNSQVVRLTLKKTTRSKGVRQQQAAPINRHLVNGILEKDRGTVRDMRDIALLAVAYDTLCRRSELVAMDMEDLIVAHDGSGTILVRKSKTDQEGQGSVRYVAKDTVARVTKWFTVAGITNGPMFRGVDNAGVVGDRLSDKGVVRAFKRLACLAGNDAHKISGHSCRVGATQDMVAAGLELPEIQQAGGWKSPVMVARYGEKLMARRGAAAKMAVIQGRA